MLSKIENDGTVGRTIHEKWGDAALAGFQAVPDLLFKHQTDLRLNTTEMVVLLNVLMHWWYWDRKPFPRPTTIARRMGTTVRTVQRAIVRMERAGLLSRERDASGKVVLNPAPLVAMLEALAQTDAAFLLRTGGNDLVA